MMRFILLIRTWIINLFFAGAAVFFGYQTFEIWSAKDKLEVEILAQKKPTPLTDRRVTYRRYPRYTTYEVIARKNLFASDRREKLTQKPPTLSKVIPAKPLDSRFVLFGIVIKGNRKEALVSNLDRKSATEKEYIWVKTGDKIGTLNVSKIQPEQIILTQGNSRYTVRLADQNHAQWRPPGPKKSERSGTGTINIRQQKVKRPAQSGKK